jgi:hypothetical protein
LVKNIHQADGWIVATKCRTGESFDHIPPMKALRGPNSSRGAGDFVGEKIIPNEIIDISI